MIDDTLESWRWFPRRDESYHRRPLCTCWHEPQHPGIHDLEHCKMINKHVLQRRFIKCEETETALVKTIVSTIQVFDVRGDVLVLVRRPGEVIRESSSGEVDGRLGLDTSRPSNGGNKRAW